MAYFLCMNATIIINILTSVIVFAVGLLIAFGVITPSMEMSTRMIFGILFMAYGIYRFVNVQTKIKIMKMQERSEKMRQETEELIKNAKK
ncbi:MAG TPA: hypothetical protein VHP32_09030 [Ignavibacteria bacterium]|nr:hypothetical protein [Ignavibacteria bacterium]